MIYVLSKNKKNIINFHLKNMIFRAMKYCSFLHRLVFVMYFFTISEMKTHCFRSSVLLIGLVGAIMVLFTIQTDKGKYKTGLQRNETVNLPTQSFKMAFRESINRRTDQ